MGWVEFFVALFMGSAIAVCAAYAFAQAHPL
jgi:hypothetical protein